MTSTVGHNRFESRVARNRLSVGSTPDTTAGNMRDRAVQHMRPLHSDSGLKGHGESFPKSKQSANDANSRHSNSEKAIPKLQVDKRTSPANKQQETKGHANINSTQPAGSMQDTNAINVSAKLYDLLQPFVRNVLVQVIVTFFAQVTALFSSKHSKPGSNPNLVQKAKNGTTVGKDSSSKYTNDAQDAKFSTRNKEVEGPDSVMKVSGDSPAVGDSVGAQVANSSLDVNSVTKSSPALKSGDVRALRGRSLKSKRSLTLKDVTMGEICPSSVHESARHCDCELFKVCWDDACTGGCKKIHCRPCELNIHRIPHDFPYDCDPPGGSHNYLWPYIAMKEYEHVTDVLQEKFAASRKRIGVRGVKE
jgi:hypothetical protein